MFQLQEHTNSLYIIDIPFCDLSNIVLKELFKFKYQPQEETGSAEEQPVSNKADAYTIEKGLSIQLLFLLSVCPMA